MWSRNKWKDAGDAETEWNNEQVENSAYLLAIHEDIKQANMECHKLA